MRRVRSAGCAVWITYLSRMVHGGAASTLSWDEQPHPVSLILGEIDTLHVFGRIMSLPSGLQDGVYIDEVHVTFSY